MGLGLGATPSSATTGGRRSNEDNLSINGVISPAPGGGFLTLGRPGGMVDSNNGNSSSGRGKIPSHPVGCCLLALLSFFLLYEEPVEGREVIQMVSDFSQAHPGSALTSFVSSAMINVITSSSAVIAGGLAVDSTLLDFNKSPALRGCSADRLVLLLEGYHNGGEHLFQSKTD